MAKDLESELAKAHALFAKGDDAGMKVVEELADEKYAPLLPLVLQMLDSPEAKWRHSAFSALSQWQEWSPEVIARIRRVLIEDQVEDLRVGAAALLGANNN